jgi:large repetitive protein
MADTAGVDGGNNFAELVPGNISGVVFADGNNNGSQDNGENGIGNVTLTLTGTDDLSESVSQTATTASDGTYSFGDLRGGTYSVAAGTSPGFADDKNALGGTLVPASFGTNQLAPIVASFGGTASANTFGELAEATISGAVYVDANNNGTKDTGEAGIAGVTLTLSGSNDLGAIIPATAVTLSDGTYIFVNLRRGTYTVSETQPSGFIDGLDARNGIAISGSNSTDAIVGLIVTPNAAAANNTFGELQSATATISGAVYIDANNNGNKDSGEAGIAGVTLTLSGSNDLGAIAPATAVTLSDGPTTSSTSGPALISSRRSIRLGFPTGSMPRMES